MYMYIMYNLIIIHVVYKHDLVFEEGLLGGVNIY